MVQYVIGLTRTIETLETEKEEVTCRLDEALSLCDERARTTEEVQAENMSLTRQIGHLQATLRLRNAEAIRRTHALEGNAQRLQQLGVLIRDWEREIA